MAERQPIDTAPRDGRRLLLWCVRGGGQIQALEIPGWNIGHWGPTKHHGPSEPGWVVPDGEGWPEEVEATHWAPLPEPLEAA